MMMRSASRVSLVLLLDRRRPAARASSGGRAHREPPRRSPQSSRHPDEVRRRKCPARLGSVSRRASTRSCACGGEFVAVLGGARGVRLLLRGDRPLRLQFADQLGAREHLPDVRHAVHDRRRLRLSRREPCPRRSRLHQLSPRGKAICDIIGSLFFFIFIGTMLVDRLDSSRSESIARQRGLVHRMGHPVLAGEAHHPARRRAAAPAGHRPADQGRPSRSLHERGPEPWVFDAPVESSAS